MVANQESLKYLLKHLNKVSKKNWKNCSKHCIPLKVTFEILLVLIKEVGEQTAAFGCYKYGYFPHDQQMMPSKKYISFGHIYC